MTRPVLSRGTAVVVVVAAATSSWTAAPALAHTGLPAAGALDGATHPLSGLDHLLAMVAVGVVAAMIRDRRVAWLTPLGFVAGMIVGGLAGVAGVTAPGIEVGIAVSVVVLGVFVALRSEGFGSWWLPLVMAVFGALHGQAHGAELPAGAAPLAYMAGFVATTAALHLAGTGIGAALGRVPRARVVAGLAVSVTGVLLAAAL